MAAQAGAVEASPQRVVAWANWLPREREVAVVAVLILENGHTLPALLRVDAAKPKESRLDKLLAALIGQPDAHASVVKHVEAGVNRLQNLT